MDTLMLYEQEKEYKAMVSFGTKLDRQIYPTYMPPSKLGSKLCPIRGTPNVAPNSYKTEEHTNLEYVVANRCLSKKGYILNARTAKRFDSFFDPSKPAANTYQVDCIKEKEFKQNVHPFLSTTERFPDKYTSTAQQSPGPGNYEMAGKPYTAIQWHQSFGGTPINLPEVTVHSTIMKNTNKLISTKDEQKFKRRLAYLKLYY